MPSASKIILALALFTAATTALPTPQLAGEGAALNSIFSGTDNASGYSIEEIEDNTANLISGTNAAKTGGGSSGGAPPPPPPKERRQLDKVAAGFQALSQAAGTGASTDALSTELEGLDGSLTSGAANAGATVGGAEESTLEGAAKSIPRL